MKILMITPLYLPHIGGVEKHVSYLSEELIKKGNEIIIVTIKHNDQLSDEESQNMTRIYRFPSARLFRIWYWIFKNRDIIKEADIIHCHDYVSFIYWYLPFRFLNPFKPVYVTFHGYEGILPIPKKILFLRKITEFLTNGNICIGDFIPKWYGTNADFISYGGVIIPYEENNVDIVYDAVFIGRLEKDTGIMKYLEAIKILKEKYNISLKVCVCGDGRLMSEIKTFVKMHDLNVELYGFIKDPQSYLIRSKFAFVSGYLSILESMIYKKMVFTIYENDLKKDYLTLMPGSENMIVNSSSENLAEKVAIYYNNQNCSSTIIENAYMFAKDRTWEKVANVYLALWGIKNDSMVSI